MIKHKNRHKTQVHDVNCVRLPKVDASGIPPVLSGTVPTDMYTEAAMLYEFIQIQKQTPSHLPHEIACDSEINLDFRLNTIKSFHMQCTRINNTPHADTPNIKLWLRGTPDGKQTRNTYDRTSSLQTTPSQNQKYLFGHIPDPGDLC